MTGSENPPARTLLVGAGAHGLSTYAARVLPRLAAAGRLVPVGVVEPDPARRSQGLQVLGLPDSAGFSTLSDALRTRPDLVIVATPYFHHEAICSEAAAAGCHLFIEKPLSDSLESCYRIEQTVASAGVKAAVNMSGRFEIEKRALADALRRGLAGRVEYLFGRMRWNHEQRAKYRADKPYPFLNEGGVHAMDMLRAYAGGYPARVYHLAYRSASSVFTGCASSVLSVEMDNGVCWVLEGSWTGAADISPWRREYIRADGDEASLLLEDQKLWRWRDREPQAGTEARQLLADHSGQSQDHGTEYLLTRFLDWIRGRTNDHPTSLEHNLPLMDLLFAAFASADQKQAVDVREFAAAHGRQSPSNNRD